MKSSSTEKRPWLHARWLLFFGWCVLTVWLLGHHELWRDEADAWLLARDGDLAQILAIMPDAGHPPLWYLILYPFAKASLRFGFDWRVMQGINWLAACGAVWLLIFRSQLRMLVLMPAVFSFVISFEYPVVARNYSLGMLGLFLYANQYTLRKPRYTGWSLAANVLLCGSTVHFMALAAVLFTTRAWKALPRSLMAARNLVREEWTFLLPFGLAVAVLWPTGHGQFTSSPVKQVEWHNFFDSVTNMVFPFDVPTLFSFSGALAILILSMAGFRNSRGGWLFLAGVAALEAIFIFAYYGKATRHSGILLVWLLAAEWISAMSDPSRKFENASSQTFNLARRTNLYSLAMLIMASWNLPLQFEIYRFERDLAYSEAYRAAEVLNQTEYRGRAVVCWQPRNCMAVLAYLDDRKRKFWYPLQEREGSFELWDAKSHEVNGYVERKRQPFVEILSGAMTRFENWGKPEGPLFISNRIVDDPEIFGLKLIYAPPRKAWRILDESFWIYAPSGESAQGQRPTGP